jgi:5-methylcytosine-specific restriction endonuclease McrA
MSKTDNKNKKVACTCRSCGREMLIHHSDDKKEAIKRNRWSNVNYQNYTAICRPCGKKGLR